MTAAAADSDEEYLYGREGQDIPTPPPVTALEESAPLSSEMADLEVNDDNTPREIAEVPADEPEPVEEGPTTEPLPVPTPSNESVLSPRQINTGRASLSSPDDNAAVVLQSPPTALTTNEASANESSEEDEDDGIRIDIGTNVLMIKNPTDYTQPTPYTRTFDSGQTNKQLDITTIGKVNGVSIYDLDMDTSFDEKPWRKPGADITDYFNYGFSEDTWKTYCLKQKQLRQDYKPLPTIMNDSANKEICVISDKPLPMSIKHELMPPDFDKNMAPPVFNPFFGMPPPGMPHLLPPVPLDPLGLPHPLAGLHMPPGLPHFQPDALMPPPFPPGFRDPGLFPDPNLYPHLLQEFDRMERRTFSRSPSPRRRASLESLSEYSFSSEGSRERHQRSGRDGPHKFRDSKRVRRRHSPREHRHRDPREERDRERDRDRERERERDRERDKEHRMHAHERSRHRDKQLEAEKHLHQERMREREGRERVMRRLGERGPAIGSREQRGRHERKKHREQDGSPRRRTKKSRHGTEGKSPTML